jgi:predicted lipid-binding transport protein (Tim44 family)
MAFLFVVTNTDGVPRADRQQCIDARRDIEEHYFGEPGKKDLEPYQIKLREAERAYGRKDFKQERLLYKKVLDMLRAERGPADSGLTGSRSRDKNLEKDVNILLNEE